HRRTRVVARAALGIAAEAAPASPARPASLRNIRLVRAGRGEVSSVDVITRPLPPSVLPSFIGPSTRPREYARNAYPAPQVTNRIARRPSPDPFAGPISTSG